MKATKAGKRTLRALSDADGFVTSERWQTLGRCDVRASLLTSGLAERVSFGQGYIGVRITDAGRVAIGETPETVQP